MADYKHFRVIIDLSAFFYDHRRIARVFVKKNLRNIADLQNRIAEIFKIGEFYLTTGGQFLPATEDIRVLSNDESVCVIPYKSQETARQSSLTQKEYQKHKKPLESIPEYSDETSTPKSKKSKKKYSEVTTSPEDEAPRKKKKSEKSASVNYEPTDGEATLKKKKSEKNRSVIPNQTSSEGSHKKVKRNSKNADDDHFNTEGDKEILPDKKYRQSIVEREICNIESSQKIIDVKKKLKQKADEYINKHSKDTPCNVVDASANIKNLLPKLQSHIKSCNDLGRSNLPDTIRLSRHTDTPIKIFNRYTPPPRITEKYLAKNRVNIVKIDIVNKEIDDLVGQANASQSSVSNDNADEVSKKNMENSNNSQNSDEFCSPPKNYVKEVINTFEKNISPEPKKNIGEKEVNQMNETDVEVKESEASNYTKAFLDQKEPVSLNNLDLKTDTAVNVDKKSENVAPASNTISNGLDEPGSVLAQVVKIDDPPSTKPLNETTESGNISLDVSLVDKETSYCFRGTSTECSPNSTNTSSNLSKSLDRSRHTTTSKRFGGVGSLIELLRDSDSLLSQESDASSQYVTKRKRIRKRKRKNKKSNEGQTSAPEKVDTLVLKPMNVKACPSMHIKFEDNDKDDNQMDVLEGKPLKISDANNDTVAENCTINKIEEPKDGDKPIDLCEENENKFLLVETVILSDENDDLIMENKSIFGEESIKKAPQMLNNFYKLEPKVRDIIAFKVIRLTDDYTPQMSEFIVGKVETYLPDSKTVYFKILRGEQELLPPTGKLSLNEDTDVQNSQLKEFLWTDLIEPKLLYP